MARPYAVRHWRLVGWSALLASIAIAILYLPGSPAALVWPYEWVIVGGWCLFGAILMALAGNQNDQGRSYN